MTKDDIINMAREAGCEVYEGNDIAPALVRFAALIAASERETCAKLAEETVCDTHLPTGVKIYGYKAAVAIRARRNHE